jgi:putative acetyltransferase
MLRKYQAGDVEDILEVWAAASAVAHPFLSEDFLATERRNIPEIYLPNAETWVWQVDERVVGFIA